MKSAYFLVAFALLALASSFASADDPSPLQDFCVAINDTKTGGMSSFFDIAFSRNFIKKCTIYFLVGIYTIYFGWHSFQ
ncbi:hypothetical protein SLEP1_g24597 [Rubroshorea leprosula]|uniref:Uncharacterized protein n=1 Tax=Rubroshorea leprosula TaxID=152421 RepID=A0AAV5JSA3_9ROSI|nr:hypothetical protein SLEP1_g24597 [Rubroshorea leprosula]